MIEERLADLVRRALEAAARELEVGGDLPAVEITRPKQREFGDFSTNAALALASRAKRDPAEVAKAVVANLPQADFVSDVEIAGRGFINFRVTNLWLYDVLREVVEKGEAFGRADPTDESVQVEFVSANPVGPLHVGTGRNAVLGDALSSILEASGRRVEREYYFNDAGRQMDLFAESVEARYLELFDKPAEIPEDGYGGEYIVDLAREIAAKVGDSLLELSEEERRKRLQQLGEERVFAWIRATLERLGIHMDSWLSERTLHETGAIRETVQRLKESGAAYESEGAVFFRSTEYGDEKDRVLIRGNGEPTYFAADCAYLVHKFSRGFDRLVYVWGADHHGTVKRLKGAAEALGYDPSAIEVVLYQLVTLLRGGEEVRMSKRSGDIVSLDELIDEVGPDAVRFTLLSQSNDSAINFDIEVAKQQNMENPVYYVQYAHARIASILRHAKEQGVELGSLEDAPLDRLETDAELDVIREISELPEQVRSAADLRAPHRLTHFSRVLAEKFHRFYVECRVVTDDAELTQARLWLSTAAKRAIGNLLSILRVSAPESMERDGA
ncbi:MAG: arginine--tRNA ligase [Actinomycetota bacterium]